MFVNLSNHPSSAWSDSQLAAAHKYGDIVELPFPVVDELWDSQEVDRMAKLYMDKVHSLSGPNNCVVHVMGEMTFTYKLVTMLKKDGYRCVASTTKRDVVLLPDGSKNVKFLFCRFREY